MYGQRWNVSKQGGTPIGSPPEERKSDSTRLGGEVGSSGMKTMTK